MFCSFPKNLNPQLGSNGGRPAIFWGTCSERGTEWRRHLRLFRATIFARSMRSVGGRASAAGHEVIPSRASCDDKRFIVNPSPKVLNHRSIIYVANHGLMSYHCLLYVIFCFNDTLKHEHNPTHRRYVNWACEWVVVPVVAMWGTSDSKTESYSTTHHDTTRYDTTRDVEATYRDVDNDFNGAAYMKCTHYASTTIVLPTSIWVCLSPSLVCEAEFN